MSTIEVATRSSGVSRRDFLCAGGLTMVGLSGAGRPTSSQHTRGGRAILIQMTGGASQLETFDPKPDAPASVRGKNRAINTAVPGLYLSESLPRLAQRADRFALVRSLHHDAAPIHETGQQLLQTGRLSTGSIKFPHWGSLVARSSDSGLLVPANVVLPDRVTRTGVEAYRGQHAGWLGTEWEPAIRSAEVTAERELLRDMYGQTAFGASLLRARQLIEGGTQCVTVNLFDSLGDRVTWDCHGDEHCGPATLIDYRHRLCPEFDQALSGLIDDLSQRGLLDDTLVLATGEFGRTPWINPNGGRDHWTNCWSALVAGGGVTGGAVIGASDSMAAEPVERPVVPGELTATLLNWCGVDLAHETVDIDGVAEPVVPDAPLAELWS